MKDSIKHIVSSEQMILQVMREMQQMLEDHGWFNVEIKRGNRSLSQNALYWMWMEEITKFVNKKGKPWFDEETGEMVPWVDLDRDELHEAMKHMHLGYEPAKRIGKTVNIDGQLKSTAKLTVGEMFEYMEKLDMYWAQNGLLLTRPADCQYEVLKERQNGR